MTLVSSFTDSLQQLSHVMTVPTFNTFLTILTGWVFARRRTVTGMILAADAVGKKHHSAFHRFFAAARWRLDDLGLAVFDLIVSWLPEGTIFLALDDTLARKRGRKIFGVGMHHDPLLSTRKKAIVNWGHSWVVLGVIVRLPFGRRRYACLPILFRLYVNKQTATKKRRAYRTRPQLAVEMLQVLCDHCKHRRFHVVADSAYGGKSVYLNLPDNADLTSRLDLDARLHDPVPPRRAGTNGRPRKRGQRRPSPREMLNERCRRRTLNLYGRKDRARFAHGLAYLYAMPERPVRVVAVQPLTGGRKPQAFFSTAADATAVDVLTWYARRWSIEVAFQNSKTHLGFEQPQGWSRQAVQRTAPMAMLLTSLITLWFAQGGHRHYRPLNRPWYRQKRQPSFADMLATLRQESLQQHLLKTPDHRRQHQNLMIIIIHAAKLAA